MDNQKNALDMTDAEFRKHTAELIAREQAGPKYEPLEFEKNALEMTPIEFAMVEERARAQNWHGKVKSPTTDEMEAYRREKGLV
ncbi:MAG TPA: hypothetical protein V6C97_09585 [Oculatellaceae cyanobacterium]